MAKKSAALQDYLFAPKTAQWLDYNRYPSLAPGQRDGLPQGAKLLWLGWDYLRNRGAAQDIKAASGIFIESRAAIEARGRKCA